MRIVRVDVASTLALRQRVLRPHQTLAELAAESPATPEAAHFAAFEAGDEPLAVGSIRRAATPWPSGARDPWRLVGMATDPERRGQGLGGAILAAALGHAEHAGGDLVWCNARTGALRFYERAGFATVGEPWTDPVIGPHMRMWRSTAHLREPSRSPMFLGLRTVNYPAPDLAASKAFFTALLGAEPYFDEPFYVGYTVAGYELGLDPNGDPALGPITYWGVADAQAGLDRLLAAGATAHGDVREVGDGIRLATVVVTGGSVLGVIENPHFTLPEPSVPPDPEV